ncbi:hypothetical protein DINM_005129 [Dirofilaria immitis]|nr:hypothetical protein [Dirofilaria immitis]
MVIRGMERILSIFDLQRTPDTQKLNYLMSCLKGDALQAVRGYDIAPENCNIIRKMSVWILDKLYQQKKEQKQWSINKLRQFLGRLVTRNEEVFSSSQTFINEKKRNPESKSDINRRFREKEIEKENPNPHSIKRRPCSFCNKDYWDDECQVYPTVKQQKETLKKNPRHYNSSLCVTHRKEIKSEKLNERKMETVTNGTVADQRRPEGKEDEEFSIASFGNKKKCYTAKAEIGVKIGNKEVIICKVNFMEYLTNKLQVLEISDQNVTSLMEKEESDRERELLENPIY